MNISTEAKISIIAAVYGVFSYLHLEYEVFFIYSILMAVDTIVWIYYNYISKEDVTSHRLGSGIMKKALRILVPLTVALVWKWAGLPAEATQSIITMTMSWFICSEGYSILWHIYTINTGEKIPELDVFKSVMKKVLAFINQDKTKEK